jgi:D-3-phosphoglycerate dehydrogenase
VIGDVGRIIAEYGLNISDFRLGRDDSGKALAVVGVDGDVDSSLIEKLSSLDACLSVRSVSI